MSAIEIEKTDPALFTFWLNFWRRIIAVVEIVGGLCGIFTVAFGGWVGSDRGILVLAFVLFVAAVWGGILLLLGRRGGVVTSLVLQALQLVQVVTAPAEYSAFVSAP
jgi:hypothetical protein